MMWGKAVMIPVDESSSEGSQGDRNSKPVVIPNSSASTWLESSRNTENSNKKMEKAPVSSTEAQNMKEAREVSLQTSPEEYIRRLEERVARLELEARKAAEEGAGSGKGEQGKPAPAAAARASKPGGPAGCGMPSSSCSGHDHQADTSKDDQPTEPDLPLSERKANYSKGSSNHGNGCRPCAWVWKESGCSFGTGCNFCHACGFEEMKAKRQNRVQRVKAATRAMRERIRQKREADVEFRAERCTMISL